MPPTDPNTRDAVDTLALDPMLTVMSEQLRDVDERVRRLVVERPVLALCGALAGGFLLGRLLNRIS